MILVFGALSHAMSHFCLFNFGLILWRAQEIIWKYAAFIFRVLVWGLLIKFLNLGGTVTFNHLKLRFLGIILSSFLFSRLQ